MPVLQPSGSLNASNAGDFQAQMVAQLEIQSTKGLVVDLSNLESLDSAGLIAFISALKTARYLNKRFCLVAVPPSIQILFELTQLDNAFDLVEDALPMATAA
ncbi:anti-anti-sigma factor [filamentous cyanobacterium CCP5]|nr:anti-anti-sigma factor [filamentous cyanobacterium CCP5]